MPTALIANKTKLATIAALIGFAANSLLCRAALGARSIDAWSFTCIRLGGGALTLFILARIVASKTSSCESGVASRVGETREESRTKGSAGSWPSALALFTYAAAFSFAYLRLSTGVGALVLFACVQAMMVGWSIRIGERPTALEWMGLATAVCGLVLLTLPGAVAPDLSGVALMILAGIAWGVYSLRGRTSRAPLLATADNFARSVPMAIAAAALGFLLALSPAHLSARGVWLAIASGSVASGLGYTLWYAALPGLRAAHAAELQLLVPILAATFGIVILGESLSMRLLGSGVMILGGVGLAVLSKRRSVPAAASESAVQGSETSAPR